MRNTVWITADMHYTAAHHYDPNRAAFQDFEPFWEFMSGPIHAGTGDLAPCFGKQFFGHAAIDGRTEVMTVTLKDVEDRKLWAIDLVPEPGAAKA